MKKYVLAIMAVMIVTTAIANPEHRRDHSFNNHDYRQRPHPQAVWRNNDGWILPAIFLGSILAIEANRRPIIVEQPVVVQQTYVQPAPTFVEPTYKYVRAYDPSCSCYKQVLIPINE